LDYNWWHNKINGIDNPEVEMAWNRDAPHSCTSSVWYLSPNLL